MRGISLGLHLFGKAALRRLRRHLDDVAIHIHLPAVIEAAQAAFLVARVSERDAAMRAIFVEHAELAFAVTEDDQVFAQEPRAHRLAVRLRDFFREARGNPVATHELPHRRVAFDAA